MDVFYQLTHHSAHHGGSWGVVVIQALSGIQRLRNSSLMFVLWRVQRHRRATWSLLGRKRKKHFFKYWLIFNLSAVLLYVTVFLALSTVVSKF